MADTELRLNGFSILGNAATSNSSAGRGGTLLVHKGVDVFEADDIIVFEVSGADEDGVLNDGSYITRAIVYDNAYDYYNMIPKYIYEGEAQIDAGRGSMGDRYLEFDGSGLTSTDPLAPALVRLTVVAGVDIRAALDDGTGVLKVPTNEDIDLDGDDAFDTPGEAADGAYSDDLNQLLVVCFAAGTLIETPDGPRRVETLKAGDMVTTLDDGPQPLRWVGARRVPGKGALAPVRIRAGALGNLRELVVSPNHRMLLRGPRAELLFGEKEVLVAAKHLVDDGAIRITPVDRIDYVHFLFDSHQIVFAEGCPAESLFPGTEALGSVADDARAEIIALFPELANAETGMEMSRYTLKRHEAALMRLPA